MLIFPGIWTQIKNQISIESSILHMTFSLVVRIGSICTLQIISQSLFVGEAYSKKGVLYLFLMQNIHLGFRTLRTPVLFTACNLETWRETKHHGTLLRLQNLGHHILSRGRLAIFDASQKEAVLTRSMQWVVIFHIRKDFSTW